MLWQALFEAQRTGVLPLTSTCNLSCEFCSNRFNPPGVEVFRIPPRPLREIEATLEWLPPRGKIVIGESATRIIEGEPTTHPQFIEVVSLLRTKFPQCKIQITTNGLLLSKATVERLSEMGGISFVISLNFRGQAARKQLLGDNTRGPIEALEQLRAHQLQFDGSVVAMPHLTGWDEVEESIACLLELGARTVRVMEPGFTRLTPAELQPADPVEARERLREVCDRASRTWKRAVLLEPPCLPSLEAVVEGTLPGSPAEAAGVQRGDVVLAVDGQTVLSRNHAFQLCVQSRNPVLMLRRESHTLEVTLVKRQDEESGLVLYDDVSYQNLAALAQHLERHCRVVVVTSTLAQFCVAQMVQLSARIAGSPPVQLEVLPVRNRFFGGSIRCAGLLTVCDIMEELEDRRSFPRGLLLVPSKAFDSRGRDITGRSYTELWRKTGCETILI
ncbi:MAG: DUF512 domain-containing protein [Bacillota bacterium]